MAAAGAAAGGAAGGAVAAPGAGGVFTTPVPGAKIQAVSQVADAKGGSQCSSSPSPGMQALSRYFERVLESRRQRQQQQREAPQMDALFDPCFVHLAPGFKPQLAAPCSVQPGVFAANRVQGVAPPQNAEEQQFAPGHADLPPLVQHRSSSSIASSSFSGESVLSLGTPSPSSEGCSATPSARVSVEGALARATSDREKRSSTSPSRNKKKRRALSTRASLHSFLAAKKHKSGRGSDGDEDEEDEEEERGALEGRESSSEAPSAGGVLQAQRTSCKKPKLCSSGAAAKAAHAAHALLLAFRNVALRNVDESRLNTQRIQYCQMAKPGDV